MYMHKDSSKSSHTGFWALKMVHILNLTSSEEAYMVVLQIPKLKVIT